MARPALASWPSHFFVEFGGLLVNLLFLDWFAYGARLYYLYSLFFGKTWLYMKFVMSFIFDFRLNHGGTD